MTVIEWNDLSDSELRAKLGNRGVHPDTARQAAKYREAQWWIENVIERVLNP